MQPQQGFFIVVYLLKSLKRRRIFVVDELSAWYFSWPHLLNLLKTHEIFVVDAAAASFFIWARVADQSSGMGGR